MEIHEPTPLVVFCTKTWRRFVRLLGRLAKNNRFRRGFAIGATLLLFATAILWAVLGARLQAHNADQLSDPYLFSSWATFHGASFPGSHTFLLKWPIFVLLNVFGVSSASLMITTVGVVVTTLAVLIFILYKIDRRPLVFGTVCLGLTLALLLVPAQPYAGGLLPTNMAMLTTRNLEYAVYLVVLVLFARANRLLNWSFVVGVLLLAVLIASDKLFLSLSAGGALIALIIYSLFSNWGLTTFAVRWLAGGIIAAALAVGLLSGMSAIHLTNLTSTTAATPYGAVRDSKDIVLGVAYSALGLFTNAGANPVYDNKVLGQLPSALGHSLWNVSSVAYLAALAGFSYAVYLVWRSVWSSLKSSPRRSKPPVANLLALALIWSTLAAFIVFTATNHYYAVDARYLAIAFFALAVTVSVGLRKLRWRWPEDLLLIACSLLVAIAAALYTNVHIAHQQTAALSTIEARNATITATLKHHKVDVLVGDYWRVLPIKLSGRGTQKVMPLRNCVQPGNILTSKDWQPDLHKHSFAYLVTLDGSLTDFPNCSLSEITAAYGRPNATQIVSGSLAKPTEALLFYDQGSHAPVHVDEEAAKAPVLPIGLHDLSSTACEGPTVMNIVAHQDDDLLFLSPDLLHDISSGQCVRTVFLTAGDSGSGRFYWLSRQLGSEAAYTHMLGLSPKTIWNQQTVRLASGEYATIASPSGNNNVSLVFLNLPDGDLLGQGFAASDFQSLTKLYEGRLSHITTVDGQSNYTSDQLVAALSMLMNTYQPAEIHTQADVPSDTYPDHSDHITTGKYALAAADKYDQIHFGGALAIPVARYIGYPTHGYDSNVSPEDLVKKEAAFLVYAEYDGSVCHSIAECSRTPTYGAYISRQYTENPNEQ